MGKTTSEKGFLMSDKKNRFAMLEVESPIKEEIKKSVAKAETVPVPNEKPRNLVTVLVPDEEFKENLKHHKLLAQQKEIPFQKKEIESKILRLKKEAWIKIVLGFFIVAMAIKKFVSALESRSMKDLGDNHYEVTVQHNQMTIVDYVLIALVIAFVIYFYKGKKNKE
jgi:hypothetical protein